jgi:hypothetical protein
MAWLDLGREILEEFSECQGLHILADALKNRIGTTETNAGLYRERKNDGECVDCGGVPIAGHVRCKVCKIKNKRGDTGKKEVKAGVCRRCRGDAAPGEQQCEACRAKSLAEATSYYKANKTRVLEKAKEKRRQIAEQKKLTHAGSVT